MINKNDTTRAEQLRDNIDDNEKDISKLQVVIQKLDNIKKDFSEFSVDDKINETIEFCDNQIKFLEDLKESDERTLNLFCN